MKRINLILIFTLVLALVSCNSSFKKTPTDNSIELISENRPSISVSDAKKIVDSLEHLGYFKYSKPTDLDTLKNNLITSLAEYNVLSTIYNETDFIPIDHRLFLFDGETLFEEGGFTDAFRSMEPLFNKLNLKLQVTNHSEEWDFTNKWLNHRITINGTEYIIFKDFRGYGWGEAAQRFAQIINDQLKLQNIDERLYLINGANDGQSIYLTKEQFNLINNNLHENLWKPLPVEKWCEVFKVDPLKYKN